MRDILVLGAKRRYIITQQDPLSVVDIVRKCCVKKDTAELHIFTYRDLI